MKKEFFFKDKKYVLEIGKAGFCLRENQGNKDILIDASMIDYVDDRFGGNFYVNEKHSDEKDYFKFQFDLKTRKLKKIKQISSDNPDDPRDY